ncbi:MAG: TIGR03986 family CRISPR-associated RAMP protein [Armatimonadetes bacterium]|nr:TIGR03986 family CRISPR-associated RAMP protein [Armatimonadota bacterium]
MPVARAPYNFVPLPKQAVQAEPPPAHDVFHPDRLTGWIDATIETLTPVYTRAATGASPGYPPPSATQNGQPADFFHLGDRNKPVLAGSSLRGVVRSVFEVLTKSQLEFVSPRRLFYRSFASSVTNWRNYYNEQFQQARLVAGELRSDQDGWTLWVSNEPTAPSTPNGNGILAIDVKSHSYTGMHRTQDITVAKSNNVVSLPSGPANNNPNGFRAWECREKPGGIAATLVLPGRCINTRHYNQVVLTPMEGAARVYRVPKSVVDDYQAWGQMAHGSRFGTRDAPRKLKEGQVAFAIVATDGKSVATIGANMMHALRYPHSIEAVARMTSAGPGSGLDMAQAVFGRVPPDEKGECVRGRVAFEDARCTTENPWLPAPEVCTPSIMSGPKPTSFQMYLQQQGGQATNHWGVPAPELRGRKFYWHRPEAAALREISARPVAGGDTQSTRIRPVRAGAEFACRIRFENLTRAELGALYASIRLPNGCAHKIGMGKNLGLGSVRLHAVTVTLVQWDQRLAVLAPQAGIAPASDAQIADCYWEFVRRLWPGQASLWEVDGTRSLASLLSWQSKPNEGQTRQVGITGDDGLQWKRRWPLPSATEMVQVQLTDVCQRPPAP